MKKRIVIAIALLILFSTITSQIKVNISKFRLKEIQINNNSIVKEKDIKNLLTPFYEKNLIFIRYSDIKKLLMQIDFIESFNVKKKYPQTLTIKIFEKKPVAIIFYKKKIFYLSEKIELIEFVEEKKYSDLPYVIGDYHQFKDLYQNLKKLKFPLNSVKRFILYDSIRWDIETRNAQIIKLPSINYNKSLKNYLDIRDKNEFNKYKVFDFRINNQLILK